MRYLLDTNILIAAIKGVDTVRHKLEITPLSALVLSPIVLGELQLGIEKSSHRQKNAACLAHILDGLELIPLNAEVSQHYGVIRAELESKGTTIGANDYWIAAQARALGAVLVTDNVREFSRVPDLVIENWRT
uniref:Ribonuclease VapC n=1 Tax=Candidatus Kentrum sp. LFY TaxID=2126342 RepID=A0A450WMT9_9GAMM|nr:MAG: tRNA(fMet)-specific endonuclease VapC [Candidatus Kentron sp. LFY]